jgi:hypothetical protein
MQPMLQCDMTPNCPGVPPKSHWCDRFGQQQWSYGLLDCFGDFGTCCLATWCLFIVYQQEKNHLDHLQTCEQPHPECGGSGLGSDCCLYLLLNCCCCLRWILQVHNDFIAQDNSNNPAHAIMFIRWPPMLPFVCVIRLMGMHSLTFWLLCAAPPVSLPKRAGSYMLKKATYKAACSDNDVARKFQDTNCWRPLIEISTCTNL